MDCCLHFERRPASQGKVELGRSRRASAAKGLDFVRRRQEAGFRQAVRERDEPIADYGSGPRARSRRGKGKV